MKQSKKNITQYSTTQSTTELGYIRIIQFILAVLLVIILLTAVLSIKQIQERHEAYRTLQVLKDELKKLKIEEHRLLIEQQTFSSTPEVAIQATNKLNMFFPDKDNKKVVAPETKTPKSENAP